MLYLRLTLAGLVLLLAGCLGGSPGPGGAEGPALDATKMGTAEVADVAEASNRFACELYRELAAQDGNMLFSPYSLSSALGMTYEGARGTTASELQSALHFPGDAVRRQQGFQTLNDQLNADHPQFSLNVANAMWLRNGYPFEPTYVSTLSNYYGAEATNVDFGGDAVATINAWVSEKTHTRIPKLFDDIPGETVLVLTNAVYFKGRWLEEFKPENTRPREFRTAHGAIDAPTMSQTTDDVRFMQNDELQVLELPYRGEDVNMLVLLPRADDLGPLEQTISSEVISELRGQLQEREVQVYLPKFKFATDYGLIPHLKALGINAAFDPNLADLSGMNGTGGLFITTVVQKAFIEVNEEGTEAAAATGIGIGPTSSPPPPPVFNADHPFIYAIIERTSGLILFLGRVEDPTAG